MYMPCMDVCPPKVQLAVLYLRHACAVAHLHVFGNYICSTNWQLPEHLISSWQLTKHQTLVTAPVVECAQLLASIAN